MSNKFLTVLLSLTLVSCSSDSDVQKFKECDCTTISKQEEISNSELLCASFLLDFDTLSGYNYVQYLKEYLQDPISIKNFNHCIQIAFERKLCQPVL